MHLWAHPRLQSMEINKLTVTCCITEDNAIENLPLNKF